MAQPKHANRLQKRERPKTASPFPQKIKTKTFHPMQGKASSAFPQS